LACGKTFAQAIYEIQCRIGLVRRDVSATLDVAFGLGERTIMDVAVGSGGDSLAVRYLLYHTNGVGV